MTNSRMIDQKFLKELARKELLDEIKDMQNQISYLHRRYLLRMAEKNFKVADEVKEILKSYKTFLRRLNNEYIKNYGNPLLQAPSTEAKKIFVIKK